ncbi:hypothetical protein QVD17_32130 [Tagetes erecta]|uniref:Uncharacterized protein n=1 Tax=Tagetes erecta TaxID=13708 RepID=A0AAD8NPV6_TARER|nr:hypothetical protein QVD17_32130 [Tagetes erecta]
MEGEKTTIRSQGEKDGSSGGGVNSSVGGGGGGYESRKKSDHVRIWVKRSGPDTLSQAYMIRFSFYPSKATPICLDPRLFVKRTHSLTSSIQTHIHRSTIITSNQSMLHIQYTYLHHHHPH